MHTIQQIATYLAAHHAIAYISVAAIILSFLLWIIFKERDIMNPKREVLEHNQLHYPEYQDWYNDKPYIPDGEKWMNN